MNTPKTAAAVILLRNDTDSSNPELFWVKRSPNLAFMGGFYAFPGGQIDDDDALIHVENVGDRQTALMIAGAARELFEELGVLVVRGGDALTKGQRESLRDDLESGRMSWSQLLNHYELQLDGNDFTFVGRWVTPPFSARRFDTWFFLVDCPPKQEPLVIPGELSEGEWISAHEAYQRWAASKELVAPPTLHALKTLADGITPDLVGRFLSTPQANGQTVRRIEFRPNYVCFPVRTPTRPPATHTNCYVVYTSKEFVVFDPGSPYEDEQRALAEFTDELTAQGLTPLAIVLTHLHPDHVGGVNALRNHLGGKVPVAAHYQTAEALESISVETLIGEDQPLVLNGEPRIQMRVLHTPGHARGHLCFHDEERGILLTGDNIVGFGSVLIDPPEGNMRDYLASLGRLRSLPDLKIMFGGHGPPMTSAYQKIDEYVAHRLDREHRILEAVQAGATTPPEIVARVYTDVAPKAHPMAERAVLAHLEKLHADGLI